MPLETATYIDGLNSANPAGGDGLGQADDHIRLLKSTIQATFPNITAAVTSTAAQLNYLNTGFDDGVVATPSIKFANDTDTGFYRYGTNTIGISGRLVGNGAVPVGSIHCFPLFIGPVGFSHTPGTKYEYLELNGASYPAADYPELFAEYGYFFGGAGANFNVPNLVDTGRYLRSRQSGVTNPGTYQANTYQSHSHTASADAQGAHAHNITLHDPSHAHSGSVAHQTGTVAYGLGGVLPVIPGGATGLSISGNYTGMWATADTQGSHAHNITVNANGSTETRPETMTVFYCCKT